MSRSQSILWFILLMSLFCISVNAQNKIPVRELYKDGNAFKIDKPQGYKTIQITYENPVLIRARYYSKSKYPSVLIINFDDEVNNFHLRYPVAFIPKDTTDGGEVTLYGPQYYEGRKTLKITPEILELREDRFKEFQDTFQTFFKPVADLIPVLSQASKFIDLGWGIAEKYYGRDKTEKYDTITLERDTFIDPNDPDPTKKDPTKKKLGITARWFVMSNPNGDSSIQEQLKSGFPVQGNQELPRFTLGNFKGGRALLISITQGERALDYADLAQRLDNFLSSTKDTLDKAKISSINPYSGENVQTRLYISRTFEVFYSMVALRKALTAGTTEDAVKVLFETFKNGQSDNPGAGLHKLTPADELAVATSLANFFIYLDDKGAEIPRSELQETGLGSLVAWNTWLLSRSTTANCPNTTPAQSQKSIEFTTLGVLPANEQQLAGPPAPVAGPPAPGREYARANTNFARCYFNSLLPSTTEPANATFKTRLESMKRSIENLRRIREVFYATNTAPWLRYEQRAEAIWITEKLNRIIGLPPNAFKSEQEVKAFADELDKFLATAKVLEIDTDNPGEWRFRPLLEYASEGFVKEIDGLGNTSDKHGAIADKYVRIIQALQDVYPSMDDKERKAILDQINTRFPKLSDGKSLADAGADYYFDHIILTIKDVAGKNQIVEADRSKEMLNKISAAKALLSPDTSTAARALNVSDDTLEAKRLRAIRDVFDLMDQTPNLDFSVVQRGINFLLGVIDSSAWTPLPANSAGLRAWFIKVSAIVDSKNLRWQSSGRFLDADTTLDPEVRRLRNELAAGCDRSSALTKKMCLPPTNGIANVQRLYDILCDNAVPQSKRSSALQVIRDFVDVPVEVFNSAPDQCALYKEKYPVAQLTWSNGMFTLKQTTTTPNNSTPTPTPTP